MILFKKLWRTIGKYKSQFISMIIMIVLGVGVFLGFNIEWFSIEQSVNKFFENSNYADFRVYSTTGFSADDLELIKSIEGVDDATRWLSIKVSIKDTELNVGLSAVENYGISTFYLVDGVDYDKDADGVWLSDEFAETNNYKIGDTITISYAKKDATIKIIGLIKSAENLVCVDDNQLMPDFISYGFCFVSPKVIKDNYSIEFYNQISILSKLDKTTLEREINTKLNKTTLLLSLEENVSYSLAKGEVEEGQTMGAILPVLFLLIAVLTMITTMHRITKNEKTQIGTLKALGFKDAKILKHYTSFALIIGIIGSILGIALGYLISGIIVLMPNGMLSTYFDLPKWYLCMPWFCPLIIVGIILFLTLIGFLTVKNILKGMPAETLRPYVPKKIKQTKLEKTKLWNKCSFGFKWNYRDTIRNKSRSIVTLIGVIGCVILIVGSMGMRDSMSLFMNTLNTNMSYNSKINLVSNATTSDIDTLKSTYNADYVSEMSIKFNERTISLDIYSLDNNLVKFVDQNQNNLQLQDDGVYICIRIADTGIKVGDTISFSPYGTNMVYDVKVVGIYRSLMTEAITMTNICAENLGITFKPTALFTTTDSKNITQTDAISSIQSKDKVFASYNSFFKILNLMVFILILAALILGVVVLYNLGVMSYSERYREFATLKVVGFKDKQISRLLIGQNIWLTVIGTIIGLPLGYGVLYWLVTALASEYEMTIFISLFSYLFSIILTFCSSLFVGLLISKKNKNINMVEALKDKE